MDTFDRVEILADSLNVVTGDRLTTFILNGFPKWLLAELNTHRMLSRNAASSRAIPLKKLIENIYQDPVIPYWTRKKGGMGGIDDLTEEKKQYMTDSWQAAMEHAIVTATELHAAGAAKQEVNRLLEPWMRVPVIVSGTSWDNFFHLRCDEAAQPDFRFFAIAMRDKYLANSPDTLNIGQWHIPFKGRVHSNRLTEQEYLQISTARCARVSYTTHDGDIDHDKDFRLHDSLVEMGHFSPLEHSARALSPDERDNPVAANYRGWGQYRHLLHEQ